MHDAKKLVLTVSLNVLENLGINLYSNVPAVLSEIVANAWDADATVVKIDTDTQTGRIIIEDNGIGMSRDDVIDRFLTVGYKRREVQLRTGLGRRPMGRKGIGKLSLFSIARTAEVHTVAGESWTSFRMDREAIKLAIQSSDLSQNDYNPDEIDRCVPALKSGTRIILSNLSKKLTGNVDRYLSQRIARRFTIIGGAHNFKTFVNGNEITSEDRSYYKAIEFAWSYDMQTKLRQLCTQARKIDERSDKLVNDLARAGLSLKGWIGTVQKPNQLKDEFDENDNHLAIFMRGKMAHEDLLDRYGLKEIFADYIVGDIHCDELDDDGFDDIATTSRQFLKHDDERFVILADIIHGELRYIASQWSNLRRKEGARIAKSVPSVLKWIDNLEGDTRAKAENWIGRINTMKFDSERDRGEMLKASILAFESYKRKDDIDRLAKYTDEGLDQVLKAFDSLDDLERSHYGQIVKLRLEAIKTLESKLAQDDKERAISDHIFQHLWLLDPSWERATEDKECRIHKYLRADPTNMRDADRNLRIDIGYRSLAQKHVIVELKRASVAVPVDDLVKQIRKYRDGVDEIIERGEAENWPLEIICLVGKCPPEWHRRRGPEKVRASLSSVNARLMFYDELLAHARRIYDEYLSNVKELDPVAEIYKDLEDLSKE